MRREVPFHALGCKFNFVKAKASRTPDDFIAHGGSGGRSAGRGATTTSTAAGAILGS